ncbi:MAG: NTP transferase domain-containing protein [Thermoleophilaceae bacterium]|nr:NTP transferase domain-containing protein [Thermoleophilaceae bacterium]
MRAPRLEDLTIEPRGSLRDAMGKLDTSGAGVVVVLDSDRRPIGTVTDGDIRRAILGGLTLEAPADEVMAKDPTVARAGLNRRDELELMVKAEVDQLPLVDESGCLVEVRLLADTVARPLTGAPGAGDPGRVVLLAGGEGKRLRPLTGQTPKPMLDVGGRPLLETMITRLVEHGLCNITVAVKYLADQIEGHFGDGSRFGCQIDYVREDTALGTAGPVQLAAGGDYTPTLVLNGDILTTFNYRRFIEHHQKSHNHLTLAMVPIDTEIPYGVLELDDLQVHGIVEKPRERAFVSAGMYLLEPEVVEGIPSNERTDMPDLLNWAIAEEMRVGGFPVTEFWRDIGHPEEFEAAAKDYDAHFAERERTAGS